MKPKCYQVASLADANLKLASLVVDRFRDYEFDDLVFDALPVTRALDGRRIATGVFVHPRGDVDRLLGVLWPVPELAS